MNRTKLKTYAPQARRDFITAVTDRAAYYGLTRDHIETMTEQGDVVIIAGQSLPRHVAAKRKRLEERITRQGFEQTMEAMAYTWFNRFAAIRFMELHGYLEHGYRVLSHSGPDKPTPEILEHAEHVDLPGLNQTTVIDLKLDGTREAELYRMLLIAQCNALHAAMPFLFERIDDETELLLPDNLLHSDSLIRKLVNGIDEADWQEVEIIGWLYQFYISEKKDQVIGKVVKSEDIPAATQLFTPNWIVKYLVQNSLGRQWMATYPDSPLKQQMEYYIEPAEQTPEVKAQLKAITPESLNPEELTLLDPACGSGHILVEAYGLFKALYQEQGYRARDIPSLILQKNLYGLEIDDRAAQLAAFALMMKARVDDRRIFASGIQPHILAIQESKGLNTQQITEALNVPILKTELLPSEYLFEELEEERSPLFSRKNLSVKGDIAQADVAQLIALFEHGKTFGSLIRVPEELAEKLPSIAERVQDVLAYGGMLEQAAARSLVPLVEQGRMLADRYDAVVTNPPYMGTNSINAEIKEYARQSFPYSKSDLFAMFIERGLELTAHTGYAAMVTMQNWLFLSSYEAMREKLLATKTIVNLVQIGYNSFPEINSKIAQAAAFSAHGGRIKGYKGTYVNLNSAPQSADKKIVFLDRDLSITRFVVQDDFKKIPGQPIAYWMKGLDNFVKGTLSSSAESGGRFKTHNDEKYVRYWWEISVATGYWKRYLKGGEFRKFYGNEYHVVDWRESALDAYKRHGGVANPKYRQREGITCSKITSALSSFRVKRANCEYSSVSPTIFPKSDTNLQVLLAFLNSKVSNYYLVAINPSITTNVSDILAQPDPSNLLSFPDLASVAAHASNLTTIAQTDWDSFETSWDFQALPVFQQIAATLAQSQATADAEVLARFQRMKQLEEENNLLFIDANGLQDELSPEVPEDQITLYRPNCEEDTKRLISYAIGCMMGRYSLDKPGLIYAHSGSKDFDPSQYQTFPADEDGIIPVMETDWFPDDASNRLVEFISVAWPREHLAENLTFIADSLGPNRNEQPRDTIRRYFTTGFYKHHLSMYKRRPIYWLFSSGKQRAFQCLVYLHRYHEGTLSRMRTEYVIPLQGKIASHASTNWPTTLLRPARPHIARGWRRNGTHSASSTWNCRPLTSSSATMPTSVSASTWMTG
jgi:Eco57I restriction-modification methylase